MSKRETVSERGGQTSSRVEPLKVVYSWEGIRGVEGREATMTGTHTRTIKGKTKLGVTMTSLLSLMLFPPFVGMYVFMCPVLACLRLGVRAVSSLLELLLVKHLPYCVCVCVAHKRKGQLEQNN